MRALWGDTCGKGIFRELPAKPAKVRHRHKTNRPWTRSLYPGLLLQFRRSLEDFGGVGGGGDSRV